MADKARDRMQAMQKSPNSRKVLGILTLVTAAVVTLVMCGLTLGGILITLMLATPLFLLFSPVLVPLGITVALAIGGFLLASTAFLAFCSSVSWFYNYVRGRKPVGANQIEAAKHRIADTASHVTDFLHSKTQEAAPGA